MEKEKNILDNIKPKKRLEIDDSYFDQMTSSIITSSNIVQSKLVQPFFKRVFFWSSTAAALLLILITVRSLKNETVVAANLNSVSDELILAYVDQNIEVFDQEMFADFVKDDPTDSLKAINSSEKTMSSLPLAPSDEKLEEMFNELDEEEILKYFENNSIVIEEIEEDETN